MEKVHKEMAKLVKALVAVPPRLRTIGQRRGLSEGDIMGPTSNFSYVRNAVKREYVAWSADGETSRNGTKDIAYWFQRFEADVHRLNQWYIGSNQKSADRVLKNVIVAANKTASAIEGLNKAVSAGRMVVVGQHTEYLKQFLATREAMARLNRDAAKRLRGQEVDHWCEWPGLNYLDSCEVEKMAKLIMLAQEEGQTYELRYRAAVPSQNTKLMNWSYDFPSEESLHDSAELFRRPDKIFVAAVKPTWRIVWVFDRETEGW